MPDVFFGWLGIRDVIEALYCLLAVGMLVTTLWALSHGHIPSLLSHCVGYGVFVMLYGVVTFLLLLSTVNLVFKGCQLPPVHLGSRGRAQPTGT